MLRFSADFLINLGAFLLVLGVLIFLHELGHFLVAKLLGVRVETFSFGFGPRLFGRKRGDTDYRVSAIPLGGYVRLLGEQEGDEGGTTDPRSLVSKPRWARFLIFVAGPAMNVVLAFVLFTLLFRVGWTSSGDAEAVLGTIVPGGAAAQAGLLPGDRVLRVGEREVRSWRELTETVALSPDRTVAFRIERDGAPRDVEVAIGSERRHRVGDLGADPLGPPALVARVTPGMPAEAAGILAGDVVLRIDGALVGRYTATEKIQESGGKTLLLTVLRGEGLLEIPVAPSTAEGRIGVEWPQGGAARGLPESVRLAALEMKVQSGLLFRTLRGLLTGNLSLRTLSGPIEIAKISGQSARYGGYRAVLFLMGMISLQLGILNLLPIPMLDGGHILILGVEGIRRRDLSLALKERVLTVGFYLILALMATVIVFDVLKLDVVERLLDRRP